MKVYCCAGWKRVVSVLQYTRHDYGLQVCLRVTIGRMPFTYLSMLTCHDWWLDDHASAIQAICAILGLAGLVWYCILTHKIQKASLRQASAAIRPFIVIDELNEKDYPNCEFLLKPVSASKIFIIRNLGSGPAMDIKWALGSDAGTRSNVNWIELGDLAVSDWSQIFDDAPIPQMMFKRPEEGMIFRFCDSAGIKHETIEVMRGGGFYQRCRLQNLKEPF